MKNVQNLIISANTQKIKKKQDWQLCNPLFHKMN